MLSELSGKTSQVLTSSSQHVSEKTNKAMCYISTVYWPRTCPVLDMCHHMSNQTDYTNNRLHQITQWTHDRNTVTSGTESWYSWQASLVRYRGLHWDRKWTPSPPVTVNTVPSPVHPHSLCGDGDGDEDPTCPHPHPIIAD